MGKDFIYNGVLRNGNKFSATCKEFPDKYAVVDVAAFSADGDLIGIAQDGRSSYSTIPELQSRVREIAGDPY